MEMIFLFLLGHEFGPLASLRSSIHPPHPMLHYKKGLDFFDVVGVDNFQPSIVTFYAINREIRREWRGFGLTKCRFFVKGKMDCRVLLASFRNIDVIL
jgi:hypothetical protein